MNGICRVFLAVCNMSLTVVFVIALVLLARMLMKKMPRRFSYYLWVIVAFRLICPYSFSSTVSIFNLDVFGGYMTGNQAEWIDAAEMFNKGERQGLEGISEEEDIFDIENMLGEEDILGIAGDTENGGPVEDNGTALAEKAEDTAGGRKDSKVWDREETGLELLAGIWLLGASVFMGIQIYSYRRLRRSVATAVRYDEGIYECENITVPFVMGFFKPIIYLPFGITESERNAILIHEQNHVRRHDYQIKMLAVLILSVYWFHPFVWLTYYLMCEDMEMSCDEKSIQTLNGEGRGAYCQAMLNLASGRAGLDRLLSGGAAFGGSSVKRRIKNILNLGNPKKQAVVLGIVLCMLAAWTGLANGQQDVRIRCVKESGTGDIEYEYRLDGKIRSFLIYKEYYQEGEMRSYEVVRADDLTEAGVNRSGKLIVGAERHLSDGRAVFLNRFESEEESVKNVNSYETLGYYGYQGIAEDYYLEGQTGWQDLQEGQSIVLAAWHLLGNGQSEFRRPSCQEFMDAETKQRALEKNMGEILYYLVFSEKSEEELKAEYAVSSYARSLYEAKNPYIGDAAAVGKLMKCMGIFPDMKRSIELQTEEEPYVLTIHYEERPQDEKSFHWQMEKKAILLLCLIENAGRVEWTYPEGQEERRFGCDREQAAKRIGVKETGDIGRFADSKSSVQQLLIEYMPYIYPKSVIEEIGS